MQTCPYSLQTFHINAGLKDCLTWTDKLNSTCLKNAAVQVQQERGTPVSERRQPPKYICHLSRLERLQSCCTASRNNVLELDSTEEL